MTRALFTINVQHLGHAKSFTINVQHLCVTAVLFTINVQRILFFSIIMQHLSDNSSFFHKCATPRSLRIYIFQNLLIDIDIFQNHLIDIDIDISQTSLSISISIFSKTTLSFKILTGVGGLILPQGRSVW